MKDTHQLYKLRSTVSVKDRNKSRTSQATRRGRTAEVWDEGLGAYSKYFICTHGWSFHLRGKGKRTNHTIRSIESSKVERQFIQGRERTVQGQSDVSLRRSQLRRECGRLLLLFGGTSGQLTHYRARRENFDSRWVKEKEILRYLKEVAGKPILPKDVENLIAKMRRETYTSEDDNVRVSQLLRDFSEGTGNAVNVVRDKDTGLTSCITFQTAFMRRMTRKFPEAICIDATYWTNINRYRLFSFIVTDKFGSGAFAQHALVDGESRANMECAVSAFKEINQFGAM